MPGFEGEGEGGVQMMQTKQTNTRYKKIATCLHGKPQTCTYWKSSDRRGDSASEIGVGVGGLSVAENLR